MQNCFHCGLNVMEKEHSGEDELAKLIVFDGKLFCCNGCKTVYEIFSLNDLTCYYDFESSPGTTPQDIQGKYNFLDNEDIVARLLEFQEDKTAIVSLSIPH